MERNPFDDALIVDTVELCGIPAKLMLDKESKQQTVAWKAMIDGVEYGQFYFLGADKFTLEELHTVFESSMRNTFLKNLL